MKNLLTLASFFLVTMLHGQDTLTVGEIFNFDINDEFQISNDYPQGPPNAIRMKVIDKHFSAADDTVFYTRYYNNYYTVYNPNPTPHLDYFFEEYIDTVFHTNLNDHVLCYSGDTSCASYFGTTLCNVPTNGVTSLLPGTYEGTVYGKGLGLVKDYYIQEDSPISEYDFELFYFKKDTLECGIPDLTTSIPSSKIALGIEKIYPNPFKDEFRIRFANNKQSYKIKIFNLEGFKIFETKTDYSNAIVIDEIKNKGFYIIIVEVGDKSYVTKIIKT